MMGLSLTRFLAVARKEWIQLRRDPRSMAMAFLLPLGLLVFFGYAITWDVKDIELAVVDHDQSARSRELVDAFRSSGYFRVTGHPEDEAEVERGLV
ncbi:MAG TPA: hypothetical protein VMK65_03800, partial [Longimicrobiales bacterium]|nr:hypothetical protein [Longimicrobiales bacterium]